MQKIPHKMLKSLFSHHHCTFQVITAHFCASLHVKTSPCLEERCKSLIVWLWWRFLLHSPLWDGRLWYVSGLSRPIL